MKFEKICILGMGYIGLPTAAMFASRGVQVVGVDVNQRILSTLRNGGLHIREPGLKEAFEQALSAGNLRVSDQPEPADAFIIAVPTPFREDKKADLRAVVSAAEMILPHLCPGCLVVLESTSPPLTTANVVRPILERSGRVAGRDFLLAYSPERVLPGKILSELTGNARVIGGIDPASAEAGKELYSLFVRGEIVLTDATTAEMVKLMENTYRDINIAIANEFSRLADRFGVDIWEAIALANKHPRVNILSPGPGVGGHCISVDPWFLVDSAPDISPLIRTARLVNDSQPEFVIELVRRHAGKLAGKRIAVLGLAFKPDVDDLRESPAVEIARLLGQAGAEVRAYEPNKPAERLPGLQAVSTLEEALSEADVLLLLVRHRPFLDLDPVEVARLTPARLVIDAVNGLERNRWEEEGFEVAKLGTGGRTIIRRTISERD